MAPKKTLKAIVERERVPINKSNGGSIVSNITTTPKKPAAKPPPAKTVDNWWGILEPMESGLSRIYLCENSHLLGRYNEYPTSSSFRSLPMDVRIAPEHCNIYKMNIGDNGNYRTAVYLNNLSNEGTVVRNIFVTAEIEIMANDDIFFPSSKVGGNGWYRFSPSGFFGKYSEIAHLGSGKFAQVKLVTNRHGPRQEEYAVKIIDKGLVSKKQLKSLKSEINIMNRCNHHALTKLYDIYEEGDKLYLLMEYVKDGDFFDFITKRRLTEDTTRIIFLQLFQAIQYLHSVRIVHRDLKPENILMADASQYRVKVSDFGLSKLLNAKYSLMNTICGTPTYVAPEIINPNTHVYGKSADMWSLGVILYICLCSYPPFSDQLAPPGILDQIRTCKYSFRSHHWDHISLDAKNLVQGLLTLEPESRLTVEEALNHPFMRRSTSIIPRPLQTTEPVSLTRVHNQSSSNVEIFQIINDGTSELTTGLEEDETFLTAASTIASASELSDFNGLSMCSDMRGDSNYESALQFEI
ncbi:6117_t:CDS:10 [Diversispora eburnea]|uniref:6117_t:CDS:1 n=1 Tax=Diversispora eburnea TaxID=1213867 RepID=A0A9N9FBD2_9GLOM|nr:6117_t:CDS:10 [Diversispora eburnea]